VAIYHTTQIESHWNYEHRLCSFFHIFTFTCAFSLYHHVVAFGQWLYLVVLMHSLSLSLNLNLLLPCYLYIRRKRKCFRILSKTITRTSQSSSIPPHTMLLMCCRNLRISEKSGLKHGSLCQHRWINSTNFGWVSLGISGLKSCILSPSNLIIFHWIILCILWINNIFLSCKSSEWQRFVILEFSLVIQYPSFKTLVSFHWHWQFLGNR
jgi:hypothetical protein